jgi:hypothetical protein
MKVNRYLALLLILFITTSCGKGQLTPTETFQAALQAARNDDLEAFKKFFTKNAVSKMKNLGVEMQRNLYLGTWKRRYGESGKGPEMREGKEFQKDLIMTIEVKWNNGIWDTVVFNKEDGVWKIDTTS